MRTVRIGAIGALILAASCSSSSVPETRAGSGARPALTLETTVAHTDSRLGVPSFVWISANDLPAYAGAAESARATLPGLAGAFRLSAASLAAVQEPVIHDVGKGAIIARFAQRVGGVEVFRGGLNLALDRAFAPVAASGFLAPSLAGADRAYVLDARAALDVADAKMGRLAGAFRALDSVGVFQRFVAPGARQPSRVKKVLFPRRDALEPAYHVEILPVGAHGRSFVVSALDGAVLFENDLVRSETFDYRAYVDDKGYPLIGPQGSGFMPHPTGKPDNTHITYVPSTTFQLQNAPFSQNDPWLLAADAQSKGNNVDAYADLVAPDGFSPSSIDMRAAVSGPLTFDWTYDTSQSPSVTTEQKSAVVTQLFYDMNYLHDWYYDSGFDEKSGNHQLSNFGRGGDEKDPLLAEAQDYSGRNNSNAETPGDGISARVQMFIFSGTSAAELDVNTPPSVAGVKQVGIASFGKDSFTTTGDVVLGVDGQGTDVNDACEPLTNVVTGKIVLVNRGTCSFILKAQAVETAGGIGVLIANVPSSVDPTTAPLLGGGGEGQPIVGIPALGLALADGQALEAVAGKGLNVTMKRALESDLDGALDTTVVAHEWTHTLSNRLINDGDGLNTNQSGGLGEGWSDFSAMLFLAQPTTRDPDWTGAYVTGSYAMSAQADIYFGVRRVPYSIDFAKDPLTFQHIADGVALPTGVPISYGEDGSSNSEVHATGEVWASMLWECYVALIKARGFTEAQSRMKRYLVSSLKMTPMDPTLLEARDAMLAAVFAADAQDFETVWQGFARRGAGVGAKGPPKDSTSNRGVTESKVVGHDIQILSATLSDDGITCDHDGIIDEGETGHLVLVMRNDGTGTVDAAKATITAPPGVVIGDGPVAIPSLAPFKSVTIRIVATASGVPSDQPAVVRVSIDDGTFVAPTTTTVTTRFDSDDAPNVSATDDVENAKTTWVATAVDPGGTATGWARTPAGTNTYWHLDDPSDQAEEILTSPKIVPDGTTFGLTFKHRYSFRISTRRQVDVDGGVLEITLDGGKTWDDLSKYGTVDYNSKIDTGGRGDNPLGGRPAYANASPGFPDAWIISHVDVTLPSKPDSFKLRFHFASATGFAGAPGWDIDDVALTGTNMPFWGYVPHADACDPAGPTVNAGQPVTVIETLPVTLVGTGTQPKGLPLDFAWTKEAGPDVALSGADSDTLSFTAPKVKAPTTLTFALRADDGKLVSPASRVDVIVNPAIIDLAATGNGCSSSPRSSNSSSFSVGGLLLALAALLRRVTPKTKA